MKNPDNNELAERIDGIAWALMLLTAQLETSGHLDGASYCQSLEHRAENRADNGLHAAAFVLREIAQHLDEARSVRQSRAQ